MDNKKRTLIIDTFDDLISMNGDVYDTQKLTVKYASCKFSAEYVRDILATLHNLEWFEIQNPDGKLCSIDGMLYSRNGKLLSLKSLQLVLYTKSILSELPSQAF